MRRFCCSGTIVIAGILTVAGCFGQSGPLPSSNAELAWNRIGQLGVNPATGAALPYGYFAVMNGIPLPLFSNFPSEQTAFFTFRYAPFRAVYLPQNLDQLPFFAEQTTFDIYLDTKASKRDWGNPDTFSTGTKVATYLRQAFQGEQLYVTQYQAYSATLIFSRPFTLAGQTFDFAKFAPGLTIVDYVGIIPGPGFGDYPATYSISSFALVTHLTPKGKTTSAVAGPNNATAVTPEFRLDGSRSTSATGSSLRYEWALAPGSPPAIIHDKESPTPVVRFGAKRGTYTFQLKVIDEDGNSSADFTTVEFVGDERTNNAF